MSKVTFDGLNKLIIINTGVTSIDVEIELYSEWKKWVLIDPNSQWDAAFRTVGGDIIGVNQFIPKYFFLINNWKIKVENLTVNFTTNLYSDNYINPIDIINSSVLIINSDVPGTTQLSAITYSISNIDSGITIINNEMMIINSGISDIYENTLNINSGITNMNNNILIIDSGITNINTELNNINNNVLNIESGITNISSNLIVMENMLKSILGLSQSNYKLVDHIYDSTNKLLSCNIKTYNNSFDCVNDINVFETYEMTALYNSSGNLIDYKVVKL